MIEIDIKTLNKLFKPNYLKLSSDEIRRLEELAKSIIDNNPWDEVYENFDRYLRNECKTEDDVINYVYFLFAIVI